jgi:hypothetical protein
MLGKKFERPPILNDGWTGWCLSVTPATAGSIYRGIMTQAGLDIKQDSIPKIPITKKAGRVAQVVEHLPSRCEALSSNPPYHKQQTNR